MSSNKDKWQCPYCGIRFATIKIFKMHLSFVHNIHHMYQVDSKQYWAECELPEES